MFVSLEGFQVQLGIQVESVSITTRVVQEYKGGIVG
jgi:hypothetical protein